METEARVQILELFTTSTCQCCALTLIHDTAEPPMSINILYSNYPFDFINYK